MNDATLSLNITSNGEIVPATFAIGAVEVRARANGASARIEIRDGDAATGQFPIADGPMFAPGRAITIAAGYGTTASPVFSGVVASLSLEIKPDAGSVLAVNCTGAAATSTTTTKIVFGESLLELQREVCLTAQASGRVVFSGKPEPKPGAVIEISGLGQRFSGPVVVRVVTHTIREGEWRTEVEFGDPKPVVMEDQAGNKLTFSNAGIAIDSKGSISLNATGKTSISSHADVEVSGLNVTHTAQVGFTAKGSATAELSASGQTTVRGAMVMIN